MNKKINMKMVKKDRKGQNFSTDLVVVIVVVLFGVLFLVAQQINNKTVDNADNLNKLNKQATEDSKLIISSLKSEQIINNENKVDLKRLSQLNEEELKQKLGITGDFAIVFEKDGKLVKVDPKNNITCIGSSKIIVNGVPCK